TGTAGTASLTVLGPPTITKSFGAATIPVGGTTSLSFTVTNPNSTGTLTGINFTDTLMGGLQVVNPSVVTGTCDSGTITAVAASTSISLAGASLAGGGTCTFSVNVTGTTAGVINNSVTAASPDGGTGTAGTASLTVLGPPTITKSFGAATIPVGGTTSLSFTVTNPNSSGALTGINFTDTLTGGLVVASPNGVSGACNGGTVTAVSGSTSISLTGGKRNAGLSCTVTVNVTGMIAGVVNN